MTGPGPRCASDAGRRGADAEAFVPLVFAAALVAGAIAAVAGFGIGSLLTPVFATRYDVQLAVAAVSLPHVIGTFVRFVMLRGHIDRAVLVRFGIPSAIGGLTGAALQSFATSGLLALVFGLLLIFAGVGGITGFSARLRFGPRVAWLGGLASGLLGGLVGNQGGIRSAALLGFAVEREAFVATATAVALVVDGARIPVYLLTQGAALAPLAPLLATAAVGASAGTIAGGVVLRRIPERVFRQVVGLLLLALGTYTLVRLV